MRLILVMPFVLITALTGCVVPVQTSASRPAVTPSYPAYPSYPGTAEAEEVDLVPPVPTFLSISDCEMAYGPGACGSGAQIYASANLAAPMSAGNWYMPFAFGTMTGVLLNHYYAAPTRYIPAYQYRSFVSPVVVQRYTVVTPRVIEVYRGAPHAARQEAMGHGPVRFAPSRGVITSRPHHGAAPIRHVPQAHPIGLSAGQPNHQPRSHVAPDSSGRAQALPMQRQHTPMAAPTLTPAPMQTTPAPMQRSQPMPSPQAAQPATQQRQGPSAAPGKKSCNPSQPKSATNCA